jgi:peptidoglycan hydrolase-like protein with peptidoglycan-binding domain
MNTKTPRRKALRVIATMVVTAVLAGGGVTAAIWKPWESATGAAGAADTAAAVTVPVELGTLTSQLKLNARLGYGDPVELPAAQGVLTVLPAPGQVVETGQQVYEADGRPVILLEGARPFWRDLSPSATDGQDVAQLEQNLARFGFFDGEPDARFDWATREAVRRWQQELGLPGTGTVAATDVVVVDAPSIRIAQVTGKLGQRGVSPATYTATTLTAVAKLSPAQSRELSAGTPVTVVLPNGAELDSTIAAVDPGGQATGKEGQTTPPTAIIEFPDQEQVAATGPASVRVIVRNSEESEETLVVPATALIATAKNSYAVEVLSGDGIVRVPVQIGLIADARVQILASGADVEGAPSEVRALAAGDEVVISR